MWWEQYGLPWVVISTEEEVLTVVLGGPNGKTEKGVRGCRELLRKEKGVLFLCPVGTWDGQLLLHHPCPQQTL